MVTSLVPFFRVRFTNQTKPQQKEKKKRTRRQSPLTRGAGEAPKLCY